MLLAVEWVCGARLVPPLAAAEGQCCLRQETLCKMVFPRHGPSLRMAAATNSLPRARLFTRDRRGFGGPKFNAKHTMV